jgi:hypothetical protein
VVNFRFADNPGVIAFWLKSKCRIGPLLYRGALENGTVYEKTTRELAGAGGWLFRGAMLRNTGLGVHKRTVEATSNCIWHAG